MITKIGFEVHDKHSTFDGKLKVHILDSTFSEEVTRVSHVMSDKEVKQLHNKLKEIYD